jgi:hypothetical protein
LRYWEIITLNLQWRQTHLAWIAYIPNGSPALGHPISREVDPSVKTLCVRLLEIGGTYVCVPFAERDSKKLICRARIIPTFKLILQLGDPNQCHSNSARIWKKDRNAYQIITGYALTTDDDMWRQHSWLIDRAGHIIETVFARQAYYGMTLNYFEALLFSKVN